MHFEGLRPGQDVQRELRLHWSEEALHLLPAGRTSGFESVPLSLFSEAEEPVAFPLANGILKVGSSLYAVLDPRTMLLSARVHPDQEAVVFQDSTPSLDPTETWEIYFVTSEALALQLADVLVWNPIRNLPGGNGQPEAGGCGGCGLEGRGGLHQGSAFGPGFALLFLLATSRRRRKPS